MDKDYFFIRLKFSYLPPVNLFCICLDIRLDFCLKLLATANIIYVETMMEEVSNGERTR